MPEFQHFLSGSDEPSAGLPISAAIEQLEALAAMGLTMEALGSPTVMVQDGLGLRAASPGVREVLCKSGLFVMLAPGSSASVERAGGRRLHLLATLEGEVKSSCRSSFFEHMGISAQPADVDPRAAQWLREGARGQSSETLCKLFFGLPRSAGSEHPHDPADLRRCVAFLEATETGSRIGEAAALSPQWAALCARWDEIAGLLGREMREGPSAPLCYGAMRDILTGARAAGAEPPRKARP